MNFYYLEPKVAYLLQLPSTPIIPQRNILTEVEEGQNLRIFFKMSIYLMTAVCQEQV